MKLSTSIEAFLSKCGFSAQTCHMTQSHVTEGGCRWREARNPVAVECGPMATYPDGFLHFAFVPDGLPVQDFDILGVKGVTGACGVFMYS